jgi:dipeptidyl-peptidase-4
VPAALEEELTRLFVARVYEPARFGPARWIDEGGGYTTLEPTTEPAGATDIVRYDTRTGARTVLVPAARLTPGAGQAPLAIDDYAWSTDGRRLLVYTNARKVWRDDTRGDYWVLDRESGRLRKLGGVAPPSTLMFAKLSPDGTRAAYVHANDLWVEEVETGAVTRLTSDGSDTTINGTSDWVYEEELGLRDAFGWSPDGTRLAYWQFDATGVGTFTLVNDTDTLYPTLTRIPYPKVGTTNSAVRVGVVPAGGGETRWMKVPGDPREHYVARMD